MMMQRSRPFRTGKLPRNFLELPYEIRVTVYLEVLRVLPTRIHFPRNAIKFWSLVPNFNPGDPITVLPLFLLCKQIYAEAAWLFYRHTSLVFRLRELEQPVNQLLHSLSDMVRLNVRSVDLHAGALYLDTSKTDDVVSFIQANFPNLQDIHVTLEQRHMTWYKLDEFFTITPQRLLDLTYVSSRLSRVRIFIEGAFKHSHWTMSGFRAVLEDLAKFPRLEEVEVYFQTKPEGYIDYSTTTDTPAASLTKIQYLSSEQAVLHPYLSGLAAALPQVKIFEIWRLTGHGADRKTGTQPIKEAELLDLLGGRARDIDTQAGRPLAERLPDGQAMDELGCQLQNKGYGL